ncbi:MAG: hypothetical protein Q7T16_06115 [Candidatus Burarchaeum sp.]|nr:hypothetical protein [Candidatus Burarchaeum sp.]MDO8340203.1 hypothetical protein [Candidatus Burarchaeum sp.]
MAETETRVFTKAADQLIADILNLTDGYGPKKPLEGWHPFNRHCAGLCKLFDDAQAAQPNKQPELNEEQINNLVEVMTRLSENKCITIIGLLDYYGGADVVKLLERRAECEKNDAVRTILRDAVDWIQLRRKNRQKPLEQKPNTATPVSPRQPGNQATPPPTAGGFRKAVSG